MAQLIDQILSESINSESFIANILFSKPQWDINKFVADVRKEWGLDLSGNIVDDIGLAYKANDCLRVVAFVDAKIPYNEAEEAAERQIFWDGAKKIAKSHKAHLIIYVNCKVFTCRSRQIIHKVNFLRVKAGICYCSIL